MTEFLNKVAKEKLSDMKSLWVKAALAAFVTWATWVTVQTFKNSEFREATSKDRFTRADGERLRADMKQEANQQLWIVEGKLDTFQDSITIKLESIRTDIQKLREDAIRLSIPHGGTNN